MSADIIKIKKLEDGYIIYCNKVLLNHEQEAVKAELRQIAAGKIGHLFFRVA
jgi:hypothetical protein